MFSVDGVVVATNAYLNPKCPRWSEENEQIDKQNSKIIKQPNKKCKALRTKERLKRTNLQSTKRINYQRILTKNNRSVRNKPIDIFGYD